ncbi:MAG: insulinase family protein [Deltaproteobacteria bacterium]|nr:insulinase family protein [Deltaproteobacteria bacterium]
MVLIKRVGSTFQLSNSHWLLYLILISLIFGVSGCAPRKPSALLAHKPLPAEYEPTQPEVWSLPNGLSVIFTPDPELPLVRGTLYFRGGSLWEEPSQAGAISAMGAQMRDGGVGALSADELDRELEHLAAYLDSSVGGEYGSVEFSCLSSDIDRVFGLLSDTVLEPRFEPQRLELWRAKTLESIRRRKDTPYVPARIAFGQLLFDETPYGRVLSSEQVKRITRLDLLRAHRRMVRPDGAVLAVSGDISRAKLEHLVVQHLNDWQPRSVKLPAPPEVSFKPRPGIYFIEMPFEQATIIMGHQGVKRLSEDHIAIKVFNEIFSGSMLSARLISRIRVQLGLAYSAWGGIIPGVVRGENVVQLQTKAPSAGKAIEEGLMVLVDLQSQDVSEQELEQAKQSIQNSFVFEFDSSEKLVSRKAALHLLEYPQDYDASFIPQVLAVSAHDIKTVAKRRWSIPEMVIVVVGNKESYESIEEMRGRPDSVLYNLPIQRLGFKEALVWR